MYWMMPSLPVPPNAAPVGAFTYTRSDLNVDFDASTSTDSDGTIVSYVWDYGDGDTATGVTPATHTYAGIGSYLVTLTLTDDDGAVTSISQTVGITNSRPPTAFLGLSASLPASGGVENTAFLAFSSDA